MWHWMMLVPVAGEAEVVVPVVLAEVGPATLTADPRLFQRRLRELHVQVGALSPAALLYGWCAAWSLMGSPSLCGVGSREQSLLPSGPGVPPECGRGRG